LHPLPKQAGKVARGALERLVLVLADCDRLELERFARANQPLDKRVARVAAPGGTLDGSGLTHRLFLSSRLRQQVH
jgi:hypothetical protein